MQPLAEKIWINGELTPWADAKIHVMSHALHYGTSVFEGIRVYDTPNGPCGFRLREHVRRLFDSARIYHIQLPYTEDELVAACQSVVRAEGLRSAYIRPIAFLGQCGMGVTPAPGNMNVDIAIAAFPWGAYLGEEALEKGVDACVSSWNRTAPNTTPSAAKAGGNYLSSYLIGREARVGSSLRLLDSAPMASNIIVSAQCSSSPPPANTMSWRPARIRSAAAPMQCADVAQAAEIE